MTERHTDDIFMDWGKRLSSSPVRRSKGRNVRGGSFIKTVPSNSMLNGSIYRATVTRTVRKTPEVMVKISGGGKNMPGINAHLNYISRHGQVDLEDEQGNVHQGKESLSEVSDAWARGRIGVPTCGEKRKEAFNIVLSMPPGTDRYAVHEAARAFAREQFATRQYVFAAHNDERHPHVHLCVKAVDRHGIRLNPRKGDLFAWRERFAEKLRDQGIEANATPRRARGIVQKAEKQVLRHIEADFQRGIRPTPSFVLHTQQNESRWTAEHGLLPHNPLEDKIQTARRETLTAYGQLARSLVRGRPQDQQLALQIIHFVQTMPPVLTKQEALVKTLASQKTKTVSDPQDHHRPHPITNKTEIGVDRSQ